MGTLEIAHGGHDVLPIVKIALSKQRRQKFYYRLLEHSRGINVILQTFKNWSGSVVAAGAEE